MKVLNRGLAILLAGVLIFGSGAAFAVSPNANAKEKTNPGRMKAMEKIGMTILEKIDIVEKVEISIIPMENGNVGLIDGRVVLGDDNYEDYKGKFKIKVKLNNVTVNIDENGEFMKTMPMWKIEPLAVRVYMGKMLIYSDVEDDIDEVREEINLERALDRAEAAVARLPALEDMDSLTIDDLNLVQRARVKVDALGEVIDEGTTNEYYEYLDFLVIVEAAEEEMIEIIEGLVEWEIDLGESPEDPGKYYGKLLIAEEIEDEVDEILLIVDFVDTEIKDFEDKFNEEWEVSFDTDEEDFEVRVEIGGLVIPSLGVVIEADPV